MIVVNQPMTNATTLAGTTPTATGLSLLSASSAAAALSVVVLTPTATKTALYTAVAGDLVCYNASGGTFSIKAPASPSDRVVFGVKEVAGSATAITVDGNGANVDRAATMSFGIADGSLTLQYSSAQSRWLVL